MVNQNTMLTYEGMTFYKEKNQICDFLRSNKCLKQIR